MQFFTPRAVMSFVVFGASIAGLAGCSAAEVAEERTEDAPVLAKVDESADDVASRYSVTSYSCATGTATGLWGKFKYTFGGYGEVRDYGPAPTAAECTSWCTGTGPQSCGRSSGTLSITGASGGKFTCTCR